MQARRAGSRSRAGRAPGILWLAAGLLAAGCAPAPPVAPGGRLAVHARWASADARQRFDPRVLLADAPGGTPAPSRPCVLRPDATRADLEEIACDAVAGSTAVRLELALAGANLAAVRFFAPGEAAPRALAEAESADGVAATYRFVLDPRPPGRSGESWVFRLVGAAAGRLSRPALRVVPLERGATAAEAALARPWKFDFDHEWRTGALALPGRPLTWRAGAVPRGARLETALAGAAAPLRYRIFAATPAGERLLAAGTAAAPPGAWTPLALDLGAGAADLRLRFEVASDAPGAWGAWAEPLVLAPASGPRPPDLVLVSLDTVRADRLTPYGAPADVTPFLAELARDRARLYERAVTPSTWTFPAHVSLMTGLEAFRHGAFSAADAGVLPRLPSLAGALRAAGYRTLAVTADGFVHPRLGFATGFDRYAWFDFEQDADHELERDVERALATLGGYAGQPVFLFFHTFEAHVPNRWRPPPGAPAGGADADPARARTEVLGLQGEPGPETGFYGRPGFQLRDRVTRATRPATAADAPLLAALYDSALRHLDAELGRLAQGLARLGRWDDALVVVTSDHGESLGEHGRMSHTWLDEANVRVPLLVAWPERAGAGERDGALVSLVDLAPTLLAAAGVAAPAGIDGRDLGARGAAGARRRELAWSYVAANNHGLALLLPDARKLELLDGAWRGTPARRRWLDPARDPSESADVQPADPAAAAALEAAARRALAQGLPGLRIAAVNRSARALDLLLRHPALEPGGVKMAATGPELEWVRPGRARVRLEPGARGEWILTGARADRVDLEGEVAPAGAAGSSFALALHVLAPAPGRSLRLAADPAAARWRAGAAAPGELGLELEWRGLLPRPAGGESAAADEELRRGLAALGYLQ